MHPTVLPRTCAPWSSSIGIDGRHASEPSGLLRRYAQLEFLADALDVTVDGTIIDVNLIIVSGIHQGVAAFDHTGTHGERPISISPTATAASRGCFRMLVRVDLLVLDDWGPDRLSASQRRRLRPLHPALHMARHPRAVRPHRRGSQCRAAKQHRPDIHDRRRAADR